VQTKTTQVQVQANDINQVPSASILEGQWIFTQFSVARCAETGRPGSFRPSR